MVKWKFSRVLADLRPLGFFCRFPQHISLFTINSIVPEDYITGVVASGAEYDYLSLKSCRNLQPPPADAPPFYTWHYAVKPFADHFDETER